MSDRDLERALARVDGYGPSDPPPPPSPPRTCSDVLRSPDWRRRRTYSTGWASLDAHLAGGIKSRQLSVLCAPTGAGKTGCVGTIALHLARQGHPVLWCAGELDEAEQSARLAAIAIRERGAAHLTADQILGADRPVPVVESAVEGLPIYVVDFDGVEGDPLALVEATALQVAQLRATPPVVVIDYIQTLGAESDNLHASVSAVARRLRRLAKGLDVAILAISSVSRAYYGIGGKDRRAKRGEKEHPRDWLAAAKESGDIEFAAGVVTYLDTAEDFGADAEAPARLIVSKARQGTTGYVGLRFHGPSGRFVECEASVRALAAQDSSPESDAEMVASYVRRQAAAGKSSTRTTLKSELDGLSHDRKLTALQRLIEDGLVAEVPEVRMDARGSERTIRVLRWVGAMVGGDHE